MPEKHENWRQKFQSEEREQWASILNFDRQTELFTEPLDAIQIFTGFWAAHCGKTLSLKNNSHYHLNLSSCGYQKVLRSGQLEFSYTGRTGQGHQTQICDLSHFILNLSTSQMQFIPSCVWSHCLGGARSPKVWKVNWMGDSSYASMCKLSSVLCRNLEMIPLLCGHPRSLKV